jgi:hypothetical protein
MWAYSMLVAGMTYNACATFLLGLGLLPFSASTVYAAQLVLVPGIITFARIVCTRNRAAMRHHAVVAVEGSWNHRRNGSAHIIDMIDMDTGRVVDFEVLEKSSPTRRGNYEGSSNGMEVEAMRRMIGRWEDDEEVETIVTDQDSKLAKVIRDSPWKVTHEFDANHAKKSLDRYGERLPKEQHQHLHGLGQRLKNWFNHVLHLPVPREKRVEEWENALNHYCGDHSRCADPEHQGYKWRYRANPAAQDTLREYLAEGPKIIRKVDPLRGSTQANESFHAVKAKYVDKRLNLPGSTEGRLALAVIAHSGGPGWTQELRSSLELPPLPPECAARLARTENRRAARNEARREAPARQSRNEARAQARARGKKDTAGEGDYHLRHAH